MAITPCGVTVWVAARNAAAVRVTRDSVWNGSLSPSRTAIRSNSSPAAFASASTRGPSRRTKPGSRRWARRRKRRTTSLSGLEIRESEGFLSNLHQPSKGTAVAHGQVSQHLAVDLHSGLAKAVHQLVVGQPRLPRSRVDPRDPQPAHLALAAAAVAARVGVGVQDRFVGRPEEQLLGEAEALRAIEDRLVAAMRRDTALDPCHALDPQGPAHRLAVRLRNRLLVLVVALALLRLVLEQVALPRGGAHQLAVLRHADALGDSFLRLELRHWSLLAPWWRPARGWARGS